MWLCPDAKGLENWIDLVTVVPPVNSIFRFTPLQSDMPDLPGCMACLTLLSPLALFELSLFKEGGFHSHLATPISRITHKTHFTPCGSGQFPVPIRCRRIHMHIYITYAHQATAPLFALTETV